jgi:molybdopterin-guanine dinucleotide biosynthesis protein A
VKPAAIVLAGGASSRFGSDKLAAELSGRPLLAHAVDATASVASPVVLVLAPGAVPPAWAGAVDPPVLIAHDAEPFGGPLVGVAGGLAALRDLHPGTAIALVAGGDMPTLAPGVLTLLAATLEAGPGGVAAVLDADQHAVLPLALRVEPALAAVQAILAGGGRRSLRAFLATVPTLVVGASAWRSLDPDGASLRDVDTPGDLTSR